MPTGQSPTSPSLRIALVCPYSLSRPGGVQGQVVALSRVLSRRGHRVWVFAPVDDPDGPAGQLDGGVTLVRTGRSIPLPGNGSVAPVSVSPIATARARRALLAVAPDVIHVHEPFTPGLPYGLLLGRLPAPLVVTFHRSGPSVLYTLLGPLVRRLANRFAVRTAVSEAARATAAHAVGGSYEVGFNGVDIDAYRSADPWPTEGPTILFLGRHEERKGLGYLLDAFARLPPMAVPAALWIAGTGPQTEALRRRHPPSATVEWLGVLDEDEKRRRLAAADILCAPSVGGESFGMVILEAMAAGTVVVASDIDGYRQAAGGHAVLVPPADPVLLADALVAVLAGRPWGCPQPGVTDSGEEPARRRMAGSTWAEGFSMERLAQWYEDRYRTALARPRP